MQLVKRETASGLISTPIFQFLFPYSQCVDLKCTHGLPWQSNFFCLLDFLLRTWYNIYNQNEGVI